MAQTPRLHDMSTGLRVFLGSLIGVGVGLLLLLLRPTGLFESLELRFVDARTLHYLAQRPADARIVLSEIHEEDVASVQEAWGVSWPWDLEINAMAVGLLHDAGAAVLVVDMFHLDKGATLEDVQLEDPEDKPLVAARYEHEGAQGAILGGALARMQDVALAFELVERGQYEVPVRVRATEGRLLEGGLDGSPEGIRWSGANLPVHRVAEGAAVLGFANVKAGPDGIVRRGSVVGRWRDRPVPSLSLGAAYLAVDGDVAFERGGVRVGRHFQRLMADGTFLVSFRGDHATPYPRIAPTQLLQWAVERDEQGAVPEAATKALEGKIVVWGLNIAGLEDKVTTPLGGRYHGPEFQATTLDNLLRGDGRILASPVVNALVLFALTIALGAAAGAIRSRLLPHLVPLLTAVLLVVAAFEVFRRGTAIDLFTPFMGVVLTWAVTSIVRVLTEGRRNRWLEGTFGRYLAPSIIEALKEDPSLVELGGRERRITILFSDVASFTRISEMLGAEKTVALLNKYLTAHSAAVMDEGGVVDKFEGDAVMAFFGDPVPTLDHAEHGCRAALSAVHRLPELRPVWEAFGLKDFTIRVGLNTGPAIVGNMGSSQRFDYTCMGDTVNLASRLEGANKAFGSVIMIGSTTFEDAKASIVAKPLAGVIVVGRTRPEPVYELLAMREDAPEDLVAHVEAFTRAQEAAKAGDLEAARAALDEADRLRPEDGPVRWFRDLLDRMERGEVEAPWSGIVELTGK